jgi:RNA polymerase sigma-70 factor (ECF subfamily)
VSGKQNDGEQAIWRQYLRQHGASLLLLARQRCASTADAEDAVQDGFVRFWKARDRAADATAYLFACVRSAAIDLSRGQCRRVQLQDRVAALSRESLFCDPPDELEQQELRQAVEAALASLPAEQREVLVLKMWGGLTFAQIAAVLEIKLDTAASRYRYALQRLHDVLRPQEASHE